MGPDDSTLPVIDYEQALENAAGDREIFDAVCESAMQEIPVLFPDLVRAVEKGEMSSGQHLAHTIKGAARVIAAVKTMTLSERIEFAMAESDLGKAQETIPALSSAIDELKAELNESTES